MGTNDVFYALMGLLQRCVLWSGARETASICRKRPDHNFIEFVDGISTHEDHPSFPIHDAVCA